MAEMTKLDVVIPLYNEIEIIDQLFERVVASCKQCEVPFTVTFVDDGSRDGTPEWIVENSESNLPAQGTVNLVRLSRNFGQPAAILAGLKSTTGDCVVLMDGDLQDPPELIPQMMAEFDNGSEVVIPQRRSRKESFIRGLAFKSFHRLFQYLSDSDIPANTGTFCLLSRRAADAICDLPESHRFFPGLRAWVGFKQTMVEFDRCERAGGEPKQTFVRLFKYALDAIFGFSFKPLRLLTFVGAAICALSITLACWFVFKRLAGWETASIGFTTLTCAVFGLGGFQLVGMGILGEYIGRIYDEVKARPQYITSERSTFNASQSSGGTGIWAGDQVSPTTVSTDTEPNQRRAA